MLSEPRSKSRPQAKPLSRLRTRAFWYLLTILTATLIGYGWALQQRSHVSIPLLFQSLQGFLGTSIYTIFNTLLVDAFPESSSTAAAAASISRCVLAASGVAAIQPLIGVLGRGWYFTALASVNSLLVGDNQEPHHSISASRSHKKKLEGRTFYKWDSRVSPLGTENYSQYQYLEVNWPA